MGRPAYTASRPVKVLSILLIDGAESAVSAQQALAAAGMTAWPAESEDGALERVENFDPDVLLVNGDLPGLDSTRLLARIRAKPSLSQIPAVLFTAKHMEAAGPRPWAESGYDAVLPVPLHLRALPQIIERAAHRRRSASRCKVVSVGELATRSGTRLRSVEHS